jgi:hypothetical protein
MIDGCIEPGFSPAESQLRFETFQEGFCIQLLNVGPYDQEKRSLDQMEAFARENGYVYHGKHHEIYLGDPRRADPDKLKTVLRQPVKSLA